MTDMGIWDTLSIDATTDVAAIQAAYAERARACHPEEHPEEFQELHRAYRGAVRYAKSAQKKEGRDVFVPPHGDEVPFLVHMDREQTEPQSGALEEGKETEPQSGAPEEGKGTEPQSGAPEEGKGTEPQSGAPETCKGEEKAGSAGTEFDYGEIRTEEVQTRFFQEVSRIAQNPYLINRQSCWKLLLERPEYRDLLRDGSFRKNFVLTVCYRMKGWDGKTILFFDGWMKQYQDNRQKTETELFCWRRRRNVLYGKSVFSLLLGKASKEQKEIHELLLSQTGQAVADGDLDDPEVLGRYMEAYQTYVKKNPGRMELLQQHRLTAKSILAGFALGMLFWILMSIHLSIWYRNHPEMHHNYNTSKSECVCFFV